VFISLIIIFSLLVPRPALATEPSIVINEIMWMGSAASNADEWVELRNTTDQPVDVSGWVITKKSSDAETPMVTIPAGKTIAPDGYFVIANFAESSTSSHLAVVPDVVDTAVSLVNSDLQLKLYDAGNILVDTADDGSGAPFAGQYQSGATWKSMERDAVPGDGTLKENWHTASASVGFDAGSLELGTPGSENSNSAPTITLNMPTDGVVNSPVAFDASETSDPEGDALTFVWEFGDGATDTSPTPSHTYSRTGDFTVRLTASDGQVGVLEQRRITITTAPSVSPTSQAKPPSPKTTPPNSPPPEPRDNTGKVLLSALLPNPVGPDAEGEIIELLNADSRSVDLLDWILTDGTTTYTFKEETLLAAGQRMSLDRATTKIALNNGGESIFLKRPDGSTANGVKYPAAPEGATFARQGTTPHWKWSTAASEEGQTEADDRDMREGVVTSLPGMFAKNWFTLETGEGAVQIYATVAAFPALKIGDHIRVTGIASLVTAGPRLRISETKDIQVMGSGQVEARRISSSELSDNDLFSFVEVAGELTTASGRKFTVNDGTGEVSISLPLGVKKPKISAGSTGTVRGIVIRTKDSFVIRPRMPEDIQLSVADVVPQETNGAVLGTSTASTSTTTVAAEKDQQRALTTLVPLGLAALLVSGWLWYRKRHALDVSDD
jgi:PKD repeat protein